MTQSQCIMAVGRDADLSTLCHSWGLRVLKTFPGPASEPYPEILERRHFKRIGKNVATPALKVCSTFPLHLESMGRWGCYESHGPVPKQI